jgi:hypothetical protein
MVTANKIWAWGVSTDPEYRRRKKRAVQGIQWGDLLVVRFGGVLRSVTFLPLRHLVAIEFALVSLVHARTTLRVVIPVDLIGLGRIAADFVREDVFHEPDLLRSIDFDRGEARIGEPRLGLSNSVRP